MPALANDPAWLKAAYQDLGLKEIGGKRHAPRVVEMFAKAGYPTVKDDETAWCSAAANTWIVEAGLKGTGALTARSWLSWGKPVDAAARIPRGAVVVFKRGNSEWQGHVGLCVEDAGATLQVLGGNQSNSVSIASFRKATLLGARWPNTVTNSRTIKAGVVSAAAGAGSEAVDNVTPLIAEAQGALSPVADYLTIASYALVALSLLGVGYMIYLHVKRLRAEPRP